MKAKRFVALLCGALLCFAELTAQDDSGRFFYYESTGIVTPENADQLLGEDGLPVQIVSNTWDEDKGVMEFDRPLVTIGQQAFWGCLSFTGSLTLPSTVEKIGTMAFAYCLFTGDLILPNSVKEIGGGAFYECRLLTGTLQLPSSLTTLGEYAFYNTKFTGNITIPASLQSIPEGAFQMCNTFSSITVEATTPPTVHEDAFKECDLSEKTLHLPACSAESAYRTASVWKDFGEITPTHTFAATDMLHSVCTSCHHGFLRYSASDIVTPHHPLHLLGEDGLPVAIVSNTIEGGKGVMEFDRPLATIGLNAFEGCEGLTHIILPETVQRIQALAFAGCTNLRVVNVRWETPAATDNTAFGNLSLVDMTLIAPCSQTATYKAANVWKDFGTLQTNHFFAEDDNSRAVCTSCGHGFFHYPSTKLVRPKVPQQLLGADGKALTIVSHTFDEGEGTIEFDRPLVTIGKQAFYQSFPSVHKDLIIPYTVKEIGEQAFGSTSISGKLILPESLQKIGSRAFESCSFSGDLKIPDGVTEIGEWAFSKANFNGTLHLPRSLKTIYRYAFRECNLKGDLIIPDQVESIGGYAFYLCSSMKGTVYIPKSVRKIEDFALDFPFTTMHVEWEHPAEEVTAEVQFFDDVSQKTLYVPCTCVDAYRKATGWKAFGSIEGENHHFADDDDSRGFCLDCNHSFIYYEANVKVYPNLDSIIKEDGEPMKHWWNDKFEDGHGTIEFNGKIVELRENALDNKGFFRGITIPNTIVTIGDRAFENYAITDDIINMPKSLKTIGAYAFHHCSGIRGDVVFPEGLESIGEHAFYEVQTPIHSVTFPCTLTHIGDHAFEGCSEMKGKLILPNSLSSLGAYAFAGCVSLNGELKLSEALTEIKDETFRNCSFQNDLVLPNSITKVGNRAFYRTTFTGTLTLSDALTTIGREAFYGTKFTGPLTLPNTLESIGDKAFYTCTFSGNLVIPNSVGTIGEYAFYKCAGFTGELTLSNTLKDIGISAFQDCTGLTGTLTLPNSITSIGGGAFANCLGINKVVPSWKTPVAITASVFTDANNLKKLTLSLADCGARGPYDAAQVWKDFGTITPDHTFADDTHSRCTTCDHGFFHYWADAALRLDEGTFRLRDKDGKSVTTIANSCFDGKGVLEVSKPIVTIYDYAFHGSYIKKVVIPNTVAKISSLAFYESWYLTEATLPSSVTSVGGQAFTGCSLTKLNIDCNSVVANDFASGTNFNILFGTDLKEINFGKSVRKIGANICYGFTNLEKITYSDDLTSIGEAAFRGCTNLKEVCDTDCDETAFDATLPKALTTLGDYAFDGCNKLKVINARSTRPATVGTHTFGDVDLSERLLAIPAEVIKPYQKASVWRDFTIAPTTLPLNPLCNDGGLIYGTFSNNMAWVVPEDVTVSAVRIENGKIKLENYATGDIIPAKAGVLASATAGGYHPIRLTSEEGTELPDNALWGTCSGVTADEMEQMAPGCEYFRLTMHNGTECGFWWGEYDGMAFDLDAFKAFLGVSLIDIPVGIRGFMLGGDETAITNVEAKTHTAPAYNLQGQRVNDKAKGIVIVNGKKILNK